MTPLLVVENLVKRYESSRWRGAGKTVTAVNGVSFSVEAGEGLAIVGGSGSGKSTLAKCLACLERPTSGAIVFEGRDLAGLSEAELRAVRPKTQLVPQDPALALNPRFTVLEAITEPWVVKANKDLKSRHESAAVLLERIGMSRDFLQRTVGELSGGQRQRLAIARALAAEPKLLILDESFSALDCSLQAQIANILMNVRETRWASSAPSCAPPAMIFITHDLVMAAWLADKVAVMDAGRIVETAATFQILGTPNEAATQLLLAFTPGHPRLTPRAGAS